MPSRKIYAGARLAEIRRGLGLTQTRFARALGISPSYLNQMERNNRPVSRDVVQGLAESFDVDVAVFSMDEGDRLVVDLREALADPVFHDTPQSRAELQIVAGNAPGVAHAFLAVHRAYRQAQERLASLDEAFDRPAGGLNPMPWEEVRDFFHYCDNYIDAVDRAAERFASAARFEGRDKLTAGLSGWPRTTASGLSSPARPSAITIRRAAFSPWAARQARRRWPSSLPTRWR